MSLRGRGCTLCAEKKFLWSKFWVSVCVLRAVRCWVGASGSVLSAFA